jgi:hypothetical protein
MSTVLLICTSPPKAAEEVKKPKVSKGEVILALANLLKAQKDFDTWVDKGEFVKAKDSVEAHSSWEDLHHKIAEKVGNCAEQLTAADWEQILGISGLTKKPQPKQYDVDDFLNELQTLKNLIDIMRGNNNPQSGTPKSAS